MAILRTYEYATIKVPELTNSHAIFQLVIDRCGDFGVVGRCCTRSRSGLSLALKQGNDHDNNDLFVAQRQSLYKGVGCAGRIGSFLPHRRSPRHVAGHEQSPHVKRYRARTPTSPQPVGLSNVEVNASSLMKRDENQRGYLSSFPIAPEAKPPFQLRQRPWRAH